MKVFLIGVLLIFAAFMLLIFQMPEDYVVVIGTAGFGTCIISLLFRRGAED